MFMAPVLQWTFLQSPTRERGAESIPRLRVGLCVCSAFALTRRLFPRLRVGLCKFLLAGKEGAIDFLQV